MASPQVTFVDMFRPPINRTMRVLDRSFFKKEVRLSAARVLKNQNIFLHRKELERNGDMLKAERLTMVRPDPQMNAQGRKCVLLRPEIKHDDTSTWSRKLHDLVQVQELSIIPFVLQLEYDYWTYHDIMQAILPEGEQDELPTSFSNIGHIAHLNLREQYLPYKKLIATVLLDKNPSATTIINKLDDVGKESEFRTFQYEVLAGEPDLKVEIKESNCTFRFDYSKVYWNSRLNTEHQRLVQLFKPGEAVCDVMAGVGPFAVPAGKKGVIVWASDLNPDSYVSLKDAIGRNHVSHFVRAFNKDARTFIPEAVRSLVEIAKTEPFIYLPHKPVRHAAKRSADHSSDPNGIAKAPRLTPQAKPPIPVPSTFAHFVMNLPASATTFLPSFIGSHAGMEALFEPHTDTKLPMVHVHCFTAKSEDPEVEKRAVLAEVSRELGVEIGKDEASRREGEVTVWDVRDVAPKKRMLCVSFRIPKEVAFKTTDR